MLERNVAEGIHRISEGYVNWYLLEEGQAVTVVDAGHPRSWSTLGDALRAIGRRPSDVAAVVLTHAHFDHVGFAERARRELGVPVLVHEADVPLAHHPWRYHHERPRAPYGVRHPTFLRVLASMTAAGALGVDGVEEPTPYRDGTLDVPGRPRVVFTPGHTDGHCALDLPDRGVCITGDALVTYDPYTNRSGPRIVARAATADSARARESLGAIAATGAGTLLPGHGAPFVGDAAAAVAEARAAPVG